MKVNLLAKLYKGRDLPRPHCSDCIHWDKPESGLPAQCKAASYVVTIPYGKRLLSRREVMLCEDARRAGPCGILGKLFVHAEFHVCERRREKWGDASS